MSKMTQREAEDRCVAQLIHLSKKAAEVREGMDFCAKYISDARFVEEASNRPELIIAATLEYARRHKCNVLDAREYYAKVLAERNETKVDYLRAEKSNTPIQTEDES